MISVLARKSEIMFESQKFCQGLHQKISMAYQIMQESASRWHKPLALCDLALCDIPATSPCPLGPGLAAWAARNQLSGGLKPGTQQQPTRSATFRAIRRHSGQKELYSLPVGNKQNMAPSTVTPHSSTMISSTATATSHNKPKMRPALSRMEGIAQQQQTRARRLQFSRRTRIYLIPTLDELTQPEYDAYYRTPGPG